VTRPMGRSDREPSSVTNYVAQPTYCHLLPLREDTMADSKGTSGWTILEKALSVVAALLAVASGILGYKAATLSQAKDQAQASSSSEISGLQAQNQQLQAENNQLRSQLGLSAPSANPQARPAASTRRSGQLTLAVSTYADFDAPMSDPQWSNNNGSGTIDISNSGNQLGTQGTASELVLGSTRATYDACRNHTGYSREPINYEAVSPGQYLCWKTSEGRYVALRLIELGNQSVTFDVVVYDPPG
jgi:cell division protein FtsB